MADTPIEKLERAVMEFVREGMEDDGVVTGWVLGFQTTSYTDDERLLPMATSENYAMGIGTSLATALGLARLTQVQLEAYSLDPDKYGYDPDA